MATNFQKELVSVKETLYQHYLELEIQVLEPIDVKGFTEICKLEGEKRAMRREMDFLRQVIDTVQKSV